MPLLHDPAMRLRSILFFFLLLAWAGAAMALLVRGSTWLEYPLPGGLPSGNALAASIPCALAAAACCIGRPRSAQRRAALTALVAAFAWLPVSIALAGNLALDFAGDRGTAWLGFSAVVMLAAMGALAWGLLARLFGREPG